MNKEHLRKCIRAIALSILFSGLGQIIAIFLDKAFNLGLTKLEKSFLMIIITSFSVLLLFPKVFKIPHGKQSIKNWLTGIGLYFPDRIHKHVLLGFLLGIVSLAGMLLGSVLTGKYVFDLSNISFGHLVFSLTPGIWEEVLFRGVIMIVLVQFFGNLKKAFWWQVVIFALCHISGFELISFAELVSVAIIGITFSLAAVKTRTLVAGIIYHYIHDAFLLLVQNPGGNYYGFGDNFLFYAFLWSAMFLNMMIIVLVTDRFGVVGNKRPYLSHGTDDSFAFLTANRQRSKKAEKIERLALLIYAFTLLSSSIDKPYVEINFISILQFLIVLLNIVGFIFYNKIGKLIVYFVFMLNSVGSIISGYENYLGGSQKAYIIHYLVGVLYFIMAIFFLIMHNHRKKN